MKTRAVIGVHLGKTKAEAAVLKRRDVPLNAHVPAVQRDFEPFETRRIEMNASHDYGSLVGAVGNLILGVADQQGLKIADTPVGVAMPGAVSRGGNHGSLIKNSSLERINGRPFAFDLSKAIKRQIAPANDANCFALAEAHFGAARDHVGGLVFGAFVDGCVGGGLVIGGKIWAGPQHIAGEWGHNAVAAWSTSSPGGEPPKTLGSRRRCHCQKWGCLETYLSTASILESYADRRMRRDSSTETPSLDAIISKAQTGDDEDAKAVIDDVLDAYGRGLASVINILDPTIVVVGGPLSGLLCGKEGISRVTKYVFNEHEFETPIKEQGVEGNPTLLGAALLEAL